MFFVRESRTLRETDEIDVKFDNPARAAIKATRQAA